MVKTLREQTDAGMMECKKALQEADGDMKRAAAILREKGAAKAVKRASRATKEGRIQALVSPDNRKGALVEVNIETDFAARNDKFVKMVDVVCETALAGCAKDADCLLAMKPAGAEEATVQEMVTNLIGVIGENMGVTRSQALEVPTGKAGMVRAYIHPPGKVGVLVQLDCENDAVAKVPAVAELAHNLCLQIAFSNPAGIDSSSIPEALINQEREVYRNTALKEGKPANIIDKIVEGRLKGYFKESCLIEQNYVKEEEKTVSQLVAETAKAAGGKIEIVAFVRYQLGETASDSE